MPLELLSYSDNYYEDWLDLVALSSIEHDEDIYIWNEIPRNNPQSNFFLLKSNQQLIASIQTIAVDENLALITHWSIRGFALNDQFKNILNLVKAHLNKNVLIWSCSENVQNSLISSSKDNVIDEKVSFFSNGSDLPYRQQDGFCDHIYGECKPSNFQRVKSILPIVKKEIMKPRYWKCFKISLN